MLSSVLEKEIESLTKILERIEKEEIESEAFIEKFGALNEEVNNPHLKVEA